MRRLDVQITAPDGRCAGVGHTVEVYPARHGYAVPDNPTYDAEADARHWRALHQLYLACLRGS